MYTANAIKQHNRIPTRETYDGFDRWFDHYNKHLFRSELERVLITLARPGRAYGYFVPKRFENEGFSVTCAEIGMHPKWFAKRSLKEILSTLVHEMVHHWQYSFGKPGKSGYHNREFAEKMKSIGLYPSSTGKLGGDEIGRTMSHFIVEDGPFDKASNILIAQGASIPWHDRQIEKSDGENGKPNEPKEPKRSGKHFKFVCPICGDGTRGKHSLKIMCYNGHDPTPMELEE